MKIKICTVIGITSLLFANKSYGQWVTTGTAPNSTDLTTNGKIGIGTGTSALNSKLEVFGTINQLRLSYSASLYSDIQTTSAGYLFLNPSSGAAGRIGFGTNSPATGFHSNMGVFRISDNASATRALQITPNHPGSGEVPAGVVLLSPMTASGDGLSLIPCGGGNSGVKVGAFAYNSSTSSWKSVWETANSSSNPNLILVKSAGNVGIGTGATAPTLSHLQMLSATLGTTAGNNVQWSNFNGYVGTGNLDQLKIVNNRHTSGSNWYSSEIKIQKAVDMVDMNYISFRGNPGDQATMHFGLGTTDYMSILGNGNIGVGTIDTKGYKFAVNGSLIAESVTVKLYGNWPDFVFAKNHKLASLSEVEDYIKENSHLPNIPSAAEVEAKGIEVAKMDAMLLQKIEELTLYMIEQDKKMTEQTKKIEQLELLIKK